jgi:hypothetical protein
MARNSIANPNTIDDFLRWKTEARINNRTRKVINVEIIGDVVLSAAGARGRRFGLCIFWHDFGSFCRIIGPATKSMLSSSGAEAEKQRK